MPFVQMENISHFLRACQSPPLNLQTHDLFQTVDLYEAKDPAQVLQCISAFSRRAHAVQPTVFTRSLGGKSKGVMSPQNTGGNVGGGGSYSQVRGFSGAGTSGPATPNRPIAGSASPTRSPEPRILTPVNGGLAASPTGGVSSWSKRTDEAATTPAWNIHQYGYMGGASQGNQGISFGGRRQITTPAPKVPTLAEKERRRREADAESERQRVLAEEAERKRQGDHEAEQRRNYEAEERRRQQAKLREAQDEAHAADERRKIEEAETRQKEQDDSQLRRADNFSASTNEDFDTVSGNETERRSVGLDARLRGQFLSQYQAEQRKLPPTPGPQGIPLTAERRRIQELEQELERARQVEKAKQVENVSGYDRPQHGFSRNESQARSSSSHDDSPHSFRHESHKRSSSKPRPLPRVPPNSNHDSDEPWPAAERDYLHHEWAAHQNAQSTPDNEFPSSRMTSKPSRPLPIPQTYTPLLPARPLPVPQASPPHAIPSFPTNPSSLLAREMERDRIRQREWEEAQQATKLAATNNDGRSKDGEGGLAGISSSDGAWDVNQYGYLGGDNQNRGGPGLGIGARRQIIGPRVEVRKG